MLFRSDGQTLMVPTAWIQNNVADVMILGREVVFDKFNIEFRQADEEIIFQYGLLNAIYAPEIPLNSP